MVGKGPLAPVRLSFLNGFGAKRTTNFAQAGGVRQTASRFSLAGHVLVAYGLESAGQFSGWNAFLYKDAQGRFFAFRSTSLGDEDNCVCQLPQLEAERLYKRLGYHRMPYNEVFGEAV